VLVTSEGFLGGGRGSGVLIDSQTVLTCAHMAESYDDELFIYTYPIGKVTKASVLFVDPASDLMLLKLATPVKAPRYAKFAESYDGEPITIIGNALGSMKWLVSRGIIAGMERQYVLTDVQVNPGNSGGPWIDENGYVVAITDWGIDPKRGPGVTGGISAAKIKAFIKAYKSSLNFRAMLMKLLGGH